MNNNYYTDPLDKARELGISLVNSKEYINLKEAEKQFLNDDEAPKLLKEYQEKLKEYRKLVDDANEDLDKRNKTAEALSNLKEKIDNNPIINYQYRCQIAYDKLINNINDIIDYMTGNNKKSKCNSCCSNKAICNDCHKDG